MQFQHENDEVKKTTLASLSFRTTTASWCTAAQWTTQSWSASSPSSTASHSGSSSWCSASPRPSREPPSSRTSSEWRRSVCVWGNFGTIHSVTRPVHSILMKAAGWKKTWFHFNEGFSRGCCCLGKTSVWLNYFYGRRLNVGKRWQRKGKLALLASRTMWHEYECCGRSAH